MNGSTRDRIFAGCGIGYVVGAFGGAMLAMGSGSTHSVTVGSSREAIASAVASPAGTGIWVGAYMEMVAMALFLAFGVWAAEKLGGGVLGSALRATAGALTGASVVSLAVGDTLSYRAGHGIGLDAATTLVTLNEAIYVGTWFLMAAFLVVAGTMALGASRRVLGWSAFGVAAYLLVGAAVSFDDAGQFGVLLGMLWVVGASIALARSRQPAALRTAIQNA